MTKSGWRSLKSKVVRSLFLAASSAFVVVCGCYSSALANDVADAHEVVESEESVENRTEDLLKVPSRFGVGASTSSAGFDEIFEIDAFVPLAQTVGDDVVFLEGSAQLNGGNLGASLNLGYRDYDANEDELDGGYLGVDSRVTAEGTF